LFLLLLCTADVQAQSHVINIDTSFKQIDLLTRSQFLLTAQTQQLTDVLAQNQWRHASHFWQQQEDQSLWLRFELSEKTGQDTVLYLTLGNPTLEYIDYYLLDDQGRIKDVLKTGHKRAFTERPIEHRNFVMPVKLKAYGRLQVYLRIQHRAQLTFPVTLKNSHNFFTQEQQYFAITGLLTGALLLLASYFFFTYMLLSAPLRFWFSVQSLLFLCLYLNYEGITSQVLKLGIHLSHISLVLFACILFVSAKLNHYILRPMPKQIRAINYALGPLLVLASLFSSSLYLLDLILAIALVHFILLLTQSYWFRNTFNNLANRLYVFSWLAIYLVLFVQSLLFKHGDLMGQYENLALVFMLLTGVFFQALTIEAHAKIQTSHLNQQHQHQIQDLNYFYQLFRSSAEGLYTSDLDGKLLTINPAMCQLFGYESEAQLLNEITHASEFYADENEREKLIQQITHNQILLGKEVKGKRRDGSEFWFSLSVQLHEHQGHTFLYGSIFDIDEKKQSDISLEYLATHDPLTGVYNRAEFEKQLDAALDKANKQQMALTVLYMDLDQFKVVNDTCGHKAGDRLLKSLSAKLSHVTEGKGTLARLGGDEFALLLTADNADLAYILANRLLNTVQEFRFIWEQRIFHLGISIGLVPFDPSIKDAEQLMSMADATCYMAKDKGRNQVQIYSRQEGQLQKHGSELEVLDLINQGLESDKFELYYQHYQPLTTVSQGHNYEILLRLNHGDKQWLPEQFYPAAERFKLTATLDKWVIERYCLWLSQNPQHLEQLHYCNININIDSLSDPELKLFILNKLEQYGIPYDKICFELKENQAASRLNESTDFMHTLRERGCKIVLDGFGNSFSSYAYLKQLPVDVVKIDGEVVKGMLSDPVDMAMVRSINHITQAMGIDSIATHVESKTMLMELGKMGINFAQGYGLAMPQPLDSFNPYNQIV